MIMIRIRVRVRARARARATVRVRVRVRARVRVRVKVKVSNNLLMVGQRAHRGTHTPAIPAFHPMHPVNLSAGSPFTLCIL